MAHSTTPDYYELLGVSRDADTETITLAYRRLARVSHPDSGGNSGMFRLLRVAYETLTDDAERRSYDAALNGSGSRAPVPDDDQSPSSRSGPSAFSGSSGSSDPDGRTGPGGPSAFSGTSERSGPGGAGGPSGPGGHRDGGAAATDAPPQWQFDDGTARSMVVEPDHLSWWAAVDPDRPVVVDPSYTQGRTPALGAVVAFAAFGLTIVGFHFFGVVALVAGAAVLLAAYLRASYGMEVTAVAGVAGAIAVVSNGVYMYVAKPTFASLLGFGLLLSLAAGVVLVHRFGQVTLLNRLASPEAIDQAEYGRPGAGRLVGEEDRQLADRIGADALLPLTYLPSVRVFHGLSPLDEGPVLSHAVVCGRLVALIESVYWESGTYSWTPHGSLMRDGQHFPAGDLGLDTAVAVYRQVLGGNVEVRGFVLVTTPDQGEVVGGAGPTGVLLGDPQAVVDELGRWCVQHESVDRVDRNLLVCLYRYRAASGDGS